MIDRLAGRLVALALIIGLLSALLVGVSAARAAFELLEIDEIADAREVMASTVHRLDQLQARLAFEAADYGSWDELYRQMPTPDPEWARINLKPGDAPGRLTDVMFTATGTVLTGRYRAGWSGPLESRSGDPASPATVARLLQRREDRGLAALDGTLACWVRTPVLRSDGSGPAAGTLLAISYLEDRITDHLAMPGWAVTVTPATSAEALDHERINVVGDGLGIWTTIAAGDGMVSLSAVQENPIAGALRQRLVLVVVAGTLIAGLVSALLGVWLGWRWFRPFSNLAEACLDLRPDHPVVLPAPSGLQECRTLAQAVGELVARERTARHDLQNSLEAQRTAHAVNQGILSRLGEQVAGPLRTVATAIRQLHLQGTLPSDQLTSALTAIEQMEDRLHDALALVNEESRLALPVVTLEPIAVLRHLAAQFDEPAKRRGITIACSGESFACSLGGAAVSTVLTNLLSNAIRHTPIGGTVRLAVTALPDHRARFTVADQGPGIAPDLLGRIREAFQRGEALPGTPGIGLGLSLAVHAAHELHGTLRIERNDAQGCEISMVVPIH